MTKTTRIEWLQKHNDCLREGVDLGMIPVTILAKWIQYQTFLSELPSNKSRKQAILQAAHRSHCDEKTIRRAIKFFG